MELLNILDSSLIRMLNLVLRFRVQSRVPGPHGYPKKCLKWHKFGNQNDCFFTSTRRNGADDAPTYQV